MAPKSKSLKPDRPLMQLSFGRQGDVQPIIEHLPRTTKELELSIGEKFLGALAHFHQISLLNLTAAEAQDDFLCKREDGSVVKVQVVEVVDQLMRRLETQRATYLECLVAEFPNFGRVFSGCRLIFVDSGSEPILPLVKSREGRSCLNQLISEVKKLGELVNDLPIGYLRTKTFKIGKSMVEIFVECERHQPAGGDLAFKPEWSGGRLITGDERVSIIADEIQKKIENHYSKPKEEFWLLVYSRDVLVMPNASEIVAAVNLLKRVPHPFDKVWYFSPYSNIKLGHLVQMWP